MGVNVLECLSPRMLAWSLAGFAFKVAMLLAMPFTYGIVT